MFDIDKSIVQLAYSKFNSGRDLNTAIVEAIGKEDVPPQRIKNIVIVLNQMVRAKNKKDSNHTGAFKIADPNVILAKLNKNQTPQYTHTSNLSDYKRPYGTPDKKSHEGSYSPSANQFRQVVDYFNKQASARDHLLDLNAKIESKYEKLSYELSSCIKEAFFSGNKMAHIEAALISSNPRFSKVALAYTKKAAEDLFRNGKMTEFDKTAFDQIDQKKFIDAVSKNKLDLENSNLKIAYEEFLHIFSSKLDNDKKIDQNKIAYEKSAQSMFKIAESGILGTAVKSLIPIAGGYVGKGLYDAYKATQHDPILAFGKRVLEHVATAGVLALPYAASEMIKNIKNSGSERVSYKKMLEKNPSLEDDDKTKEYYSLIVSSNKLYRNAPIQTGQMIKTLLEQNQIVTPDMIQKLVSGNSKTLDKGFLSPGKPYESGITYYDPNN